MSQAEQTDYIPCKACKEPIRPDASICPHCRVRQKRSATQILSEYLKWAGAVAALITLILSASELNKLVEIWLKNERVVDEYIAAAQFLADSGDHLNAQVLLQQVSQLDPASSDLRDLQLALAQEKIRTFLLLDRDGHYPAQLVSERDKKGREVLDFKYRGNTSAEIDKLQPEKLVTLFARGIVSGKQTQTASLLAHLGWLESLQRFGLRQKDIAKYFQDALKLEPQNPYANAMYAAWLLAPRNNTSASAQQRLQQAEVHFFRARKNKEATPWVIALWLEALVVADFAEADFALLRALQQLKQNDYPLYQNGPVQSALKASFINRVAKGRPANEQNEAQLQQLFAIFPPAELLAQLNWMTTLVFGCAPGPGCAAEDRDMANLLYLSGRLHDRLGQQQQALQAYRLAQTEGYRVSLVTEPVLQHLQQTLGATAKRVLAYRYRQDEPLQKNDLLLSYAGQKLPDEEQLYALNLAASTDDIPVEVLRQGQVLELRVEPLSQQHFFPFIIPAELLQPGQAQELKRWLSHTE